MAPVKITADNADTTVWTSSTDAQGGPAATNSFAKDSFGKLICAFVQIGGTGRVAWSNDNGATWTVGTDATSFSINLTTARHMGVVVSGNKAVLGYLRFATTIRLMVERWTITRDGSNNITNIAQDNVVTDASTGSGNINWKFRKIELSPNADEVVAMCKFGAAQAWLGFIRAKISDATYKSLPGTASTMTLFEQGADQLASSFEIHPVTKDIWHMNATVGAAGNGIVSRYRLPFNSGTGDWSETPTVNESVGGVGHFAQTDDLLNSCVDTVNNKLYWVIWNGKSDQLKYRLFVVEADGDTRSELTSIPSPGNNTVLAIAIGVRSGILYLYGIDNNVFGVGTRQIYYRKWNGSSWSSAFDLGDSDVHSIATFDGDVQYIYGRLGSNFWYASLTLPDFNLTKLIDFSTAFLDTGGNRQTVAGMGSVGVIGTDTVTVSLSVTSAGTGGAVSPASFVISQGSVGTFTVSTSFNTVTNGDVVVTGSAGIDSLSTEHNLAFPFSIRPPLAPQGRNLVIEYDSTGAPTGNAKLDGKSVTIPTGSVGSLIFTSLTQIVADVEEGELSTQTRPNRLYVQVGAQVDERNVAIALDPSTQKLVKFLIT